MKKEEEILIIPKYLSTLEAFKIINTGALEIVNKWRAGQKNVLDKVNANGVHDVVTEVDLAIEELTSKISKEFIPGVRIFGEENFRQDFSVTTEPFYIVIDPIDGTKEFVKGSTDWSISICAVENGIPVVSSVFMPDRNEVFTAIKGEGTKLNDRLLMVNGNAPSEIAVSPRQIKDENIAKRILTSAHKPIEVPALTPKICAILRGDVSAAVYFSQKGQSASLWDYAASVLLINEFGGKITSLTGKKLPFIGSEVIYKEGWLATNDPIRHSELLLCLSGAVCI
ncbi:hypothetical protein COY87_00950 [Candidatus Roizmanbacteria bacterium CG_4_10_14_0_8_um_filter_33_9]|uniref:3'(2'),5'-bisphosphate nucleotidase CysQ n=1 Tax=Candidatus Roizmanbacteria bacterium CG_4_10_14_0_8_um_filter_33_9 TaxID=1974826 RepID=A0A2M7QKD1_9BACT|nr:MAG: hypothetical protein COY87_00950 [Candidatus Roizmanbacteria bacterium CG_4_10_14_0_8_um_filter_33_9]